MAESYIPITTADTPDAKLRSFSRTIGANDVEEEIIVVGEPYLPTYSAAPAASVVTTDQAHILELMAGASLNLCIRYIKVTQLVAANAATTMGLRVVRLTTAGTGGASVPIGSYDPADPAVGATGMNLPSSKGTVGTVLIRGSLGLGTAHPTSSNFFEWRRPEGGKGIIVPAGTSNGLAILHIGTDTTATVNVLVEFTEAI